jgi:predicted nucleic acid-binding protein
MSESPNKIYWDTSCFICFLNEGEESRRKICEDILGNARSGHVELYTSTFTIAEVVRPKRPGTAPLPEWATKAIEAVSKEFPSAQAEMEALWKRHQVNNPSFALTPTQIAKIEGMFKWDFIKLVDLDERVAFKAVELARDYGLKPADSVHAASALIVPVPVLQMWDRDYEKIASLIKVENPKYVSKIGPLFLGVKGIDLNVGPTPEDFEDEDIEDEDLDEQQTVDTSTTKTAGGIGGPVEDEAGTGDIPAAESEPIPDAIIEEGEGRGERPEAAS